MFRARWVLSKSSCRPPSSAVAAAAAGKAKVHTSTCPSRTASIMNSASLLGNGLKQIWGAYERQLERHPITTQMTTSFLLWGSGDLIAQRMERWEQQQQILKQQLKQQQQSKKKKAVKGAPPGSSELSTSSSSSDADSGYDMRRAFFTALFGATFVGPVGHFWYQAIDRWCKALIPKGGPAFIATKVLIDTAAMGPFYVAAFFAWGCALIDHSGWPEFKRKMKVDFVPTLAAEVSIWPIVQSVNFSVVPLQHQLLVINVFTIIDAAFMSWARNQEDWVTKVLAALPGGSKGGSSSSGAQLQMKPLVVESSKGK